ncbi:MAG: DUF5011 domain-containing protein, partial [Parcubacteria group bacterium]|nr:DUF5011 domain-containing protein [Parcubacteria group bacterium]
IEVTGTVSTTTPGTYTLHYNVKDSKGLAAEEKTRTVVVKGADNACKNILLVSDTSDKVEGGGNAVFTYDQSQKWTAQIFGAHWIWKSFLVEEPQGTTTIRLSKDFTIIGGSASSTLIVAADDYYTVWINGHHIATENTVVLDESDANFSHGNERTYHPESFLVPGLNTITFELTNAAYFYPGVATSYNNPSGLLYSFEIVPCAVAATNTPPVITLIGATTTTITVGTEFTDPGATAQSYRHGINHHSGNLHPAL